MSNTKIIHELNNIDLILTEYEVCS